MGEETKAEEVKVEVQEVRRAAVAWRGSRGG